MKNKYLRMNQIHNQEDKQPRANWDSYNKVSSRQLMFFKDIKELLEATMKPLKGVKSGFYNEGSTKFNISFETIDYHHHIELRLRMNRVDWGTTEVVQLSYQSVFHNSDDLHKNQSESHNSLELWFRRDGLVTDKHGHFKTSWEDESGMCSVINKLLEETYPLKT